MIGKNLRGWMSRRFRWGQTANLIFRAVETMRQGRMYDDVAVVEFQTSDGHRFELKIRCLPPGDSDSP